MSAVPPLRGAWHERTQPWYDVRVVNCAVCGRLLLRRSWIFTDEDAGAMAVCDPDCEALWYRYARGRRLATPS
jgi:hypothetical protein